MTSFASQLPWLPLAKAAEKVSELTGKHHSEADILRAALAGHLTLSVQLVSPVFARQGHFQKLFQDAPHGISANVSPLCAGNGVGREKRVLPEFLGIGDVAFAYSSDQGEYVQGLLDLLLIRNGKAHVQNLERRLQGECEGYLLPSGGIYLKGPTGIFWELQEQLDNDSTLSDDHEIEYTPAERSREDWRIVVRPSELERLLSFHEKPIAPVAAPPTTARTENHLSEGKKTMPKRAADYEAYLHDFRDGAVWLLKEDALCLGAGYLPVYDDKKLAPKLLAPNEQAELNLPTLLGAFNDTRDWLKITRPMTFERDGYRYVEARGFLDWLSRYIDQTQAKEFTFPGELADAIKRARVMAAASAPAADEEFVSLTRALDGWFDKDWECLPPALRQQIEQKTTVLQFLWKTISPEQRLDCARQWDYRHDPATEPERQRLFQFYAELNDKLQEARDKLAEWESVAAPDAGDLEKKESHIEKWRREVARLELLENSAQATTCDDTSRLGDGMESAGVGVDYKSLLGEMEKAVIGPEKLCRAFGCGENSFSAVTRRVKAYNDRYPDAPIQFGRIGQSPILYWHEIYKIIGAVGGCSGKRTRKKTSKKT